MRFQFSRAADEAVIPHVLLWGDSGVGKTAASVLAAADLDVDLRAAARGEGPRPQGDARILLLTGEPNAIETARQVNPLCRTFLFKTYDQAIEVLQAAVDGELSAEFDQIAFDGLSELQKQKIEGMNRDSKTFWNELLATSHSFLRLIRSIPLPVICTALSTVKQNDLTKVETVGPALEPRSLPGHAMSTMAAAGRATKAGEGDAMRYVVDFSGLPDRYQIKEVGALTRRVKPCAAAWIRVFRGKLPPESIRFVGPDPVPERALVAQATAANAAPATGARRVARG